MELLLGFIFGTILWKLYNDFKVPIRSFCKIWLLKRSVKKHLNLLKKSKESFDAELLSVMLLDMFKFYENSISRPIVMERLFPSKNMPDQTGLDDFELATKQMLLPYYMIFQNLKTYDLGLITMTELLLRLDKICL